MPRQRRCQKAYFELLSLSPISIMITLTCRMTSGESRKFESLYACSLPNIRIQKRYPTNWDHDDGPWSLSWLLKIKFCHLRSLGVSLGPFIRPPWKSSIVDLPVSMSTFSYWYSKVLKITFRMQHSSLDQSIKQTSLFFACLQVCCYDRSIVMLHLMCKWWLSKSAALQPLRAFQFSK